MLPDRSVVSSGSVGIVTHSQRLLRSSGTTTLFEGVYTCSQNGSEIHIGLYSSSIINNGETQGFSITIDTMRYTNFVISYFAVVEVELAVQISDLFNQSVGPTVSMTCTTRGFPPTCFHWYHNGTNINQTVSLVNASETIYISSYTTLDRDSYMGNHTCDALSTGAGIKHNSSNMVIESE